MGRYTSDENTVIFKHESGTYGTASGNGVWIGLVEENTISDDEGYSQYRYIGTGSRTSQIWEQGTSAAEGTISYRVQDWKLIFHAIGSVAETSGTNMTHTATEILTGGRQSPFTSGPLNPPTSFTIEDAKKTYGTNDNFIRTVNGAVPSSFTLNFEQGERVTAEVGYIGQKVVFTSGTPTTVTALSGDSYQWGNVTITAGGSSLRAVKSASLEMSNNTEPAYYLGGSRYGDVPINLNKDYTISLTMDGYSPDMRLMYNVFFKENGNFNCTIDLNEDGSTGSKHAIFVLSGCRVVSADVPATSEGVDEATFEIAAQNCSATAYDRVYRYNPF